MSTIYGRPLFIGSASPKVPEIFGTGADGDLYIAAGETVTLPVPVPHQSVVEMNYTSITIEAGGTLTTSDPNAGLVLRCQGDCTIHGTIDQSGKAPKTNPDSTYQYPEELQCGDGGAGGNGGIFSTQQDSFGTGGAGMSKRPYGGGYSGGGGGGGGNTSSYKGKPGGSADEITVDTEDSLMFYGATGEAGQNGGGGCGGYNAGSGVSGGSGPGGAGMSAPNGQGGGAGGAGNIGGGVTLLYVGGTVMIDGSIDCSGKSGGNGGSAAYGSGGGSGGGAGGGAVYILHMGTQTITGSLDVSGGNPGSVGASGGPSNIFHSGSPGTAGGIGTATVKQYTEEAA